MSTASIVHTDVGISALKRFSARSGGGHPAAPAAVAKAWHHVILRYDRVMRRIPALIVLALLAACHRYWTAADDFQRRLRCGMTEEEVRALSSML